MAHERHVRNGPEHHRLVDKRRGGEPRHDRDPRAGAHDLGSDRELVDPVVDPRRLTDPRTQMLALGALCLMRRERLPTGRGLVIAIVLGCSQAAVIGLETWGVHLTTATNAGLLISLALVLTPALEGAASRSWLPRPYFVAAVAAVVGVAILVTASGHLTRARSDSTFGVVLVQMTVCALLFSVFAGPGLVSTVVGLDAASWAYAVFLGLMCSVFAFVVQLWAVRRTSASRASILMGTEPVWALLVGILLAGETITPLGVCGASLIVGASYAGQAIERRHRTRLLLAQPSGSIVCAREEV